jgi:hypothetical protein
VLHQALEECSDSVRDFSRSLNLGEGMVLQIGGKQ